ncbi:ATP-dependent DNA ligase [Nakamurella sp. YIM 132084]|uniref:DNA ligase (ATP) n=1 Tax=Nakamurella leprariae TaxID=2803911 RepID=A0A938YFM8_9ACTN|nr:ATP-dependent DNA ligase [Nakamurella leprariae]
MLSTLAQASAELAATRSRTAKRVVIASVVRQAVLDGADDGAADELRVVVTYLTGSLRQRRTGIGWATLRDAPAPAAAPSLTVGEVDAAFAATAELAGAGSAAARTGAVAALFARATAPEQHLLRGLIAGELRQGALESAVQDGVAAAFGVPVAAVRRAAMLLGSTPEAAALMAGQVPGGAAPDGTADEAAPLADPATVLQALAALRIRVGQPVHPMLAASAPDPAGAVAKTGLPAVVDAKLDGIRIQVHRSGPEVRLFTRSLDEITGRLPEIVAAVRSLDVREVVLDGEVVALDESGRPRAFQEIAARTATGRRHTGVDDTADPAAAELPADPGLPLSLSCFDVLHVDGDDLLDEPLRRRDEVLTRLVPAALRIPRTWAETPEVVEATFLDAVAAGWEGVVVKAPDAGYAAGRRDAGWIKVKPRHTFDLAVVAAEWGYGRRQGWLSNLHLAARDERSGELVMLGKTFKGLTDATLTWQTQQFLAREQRRTKTTVWADPPLVAEIAIDGIQRSPRYPGGIALRFARVLRYRDDKRVDEVDTLQTVLALSGPPAAAGED